LSRRTMGVAPTSSRMFGYSRATSRKGMRREF
jgi:hypothetical protein